MIRWLYANNMKGTRMRVSRLMPVFGSILTLLVATSACRPRSQPLAEKDAAVPADPVSPRRPTLPAEPAPPDADLAREVPDLEAKLAKDPAYVAVWTSPRADLNAFLTAVSETFAFGGVTKTVTDLLRQRKLFDAMVKLAQISSRKGAFPDDFLAKLAAHLAGVKGESHLGTWSLPVKGQPPHDFTAIAAWTNREDAAYFRERLAAKVDGPIPWATYTPDPKQPALRPYLVDEAKAYEWLGLLTRLTADEKARVDQLRLDASVLKVPIRTLLSEYKDNELRGDAKFKGKLVQVAGVAGDVKKDVLGSAFVIVGAGPDLAIPQVQCFFDDKHEKRIATISKGDPITVRGRVDGLMMNVLVKDCELVK